MIKIFGLRVRDLAIEAPSGLAELVYHSLISHARVQHEPTVSNILLILNRD
jgi:hypothetical protein